MAGSAISEMIFFIAAIMISSAVAVTLIEVVDEYSEDLSDEASILRWEMRSDMTFINDPLHIPYNSSTGNLTLYVKNTGTGDLSLGDLVISINGTTKTGNDIMKTILGGGASWSPGKTVQVNMNVPGMNEDMDYHGWGTTSGITSSGGRRGTAQDTLVFRIWEV
jgi:flagellar protein FlaG